MKPFLSSSAMRDADRRAIEDIGIPGFTLMETAGRGAAAAIARHAPAGPVGILCGKGNNGGDGLVVARVLADAGREVRLHMAQGDEDLSDDASANLRILERLAPPSLERAREISDLSGCAVLVDAMLGTGQRSAPRTPLDQAVAWLNRQRAFVVALDVPTGLHADHGEILGEAVQADLTVAMGAWKTGLLTGLGPEVCGHVEVLEIGIPRPVLAEAAGQKGSGLLADDGFVRSVLPTRRRDAYKYSTGPTLVIGGSRKYPGAPVLAATAAARVGSGYVVAALPEDVVWQGPVEIPAVPREDLDSWMGRARAVLIGPGLGRSQSAFDLVQAVLGKTPCPVIVDADALHALPERGILGSWNSPAVLTPHAGEFEAMAGEPIGPDRVQTAVSYAARWQAVLVLKGSPTIIAHPDGRTVICTAGGPQLATAGTGDVLGGLCAGLVAMGLDPFEAAVAGTHIGGAVAEHFVATRGHASMLAGDLVRHLPSVLSNRFHQ